MHEQFQTPQRIGGANRTDELALMPTLSRIACTQAGVHWSISAQTGNEPFQGIADTRGEAWVGYGRPNSMDGIVT